MRRRQTCQALSLLPLGALALPARAQGLASLSELDAARGVKGALERGALAAIQLLGREDGFLAHPHVRIPLPGYLKDTARFLSAIGQRRQVEELEIALNRAAEAAIPMAKDLVVSAVKNMTVSDARKILAGGDTSVTAFFAARTREALSVQFLPVVQQATARVQLKEPAERLTQRAQALGLVRTEDPTIDHYVTRKALDGLYFVIGEEERRIRRDPVATGNALLSKVFGALR